MHAVAYGAVFCIGLLGLLASWLALRQVQAFVALRTASGI